ncbi:hypothetical protein [Butyricimonas virosa]|uniref:hypothetical protein n=1 Tax=Butyricimonas virosa TaxID=544645 RepID=UPI003AAF32DE
MESTITKKAITYSLLAHIKNSGTLSDGPLDVFIPIVKKGLHLMNSKKVQCKGANISEISTIINEQYIIDIPIPVLRSVLKKIAKEVNSEKEKVFELYNDDSFWIKDYIFEDYDEHLEKSKKNIQQLQMLFKKFCKINNINNKDNNCVINFIEKNKTSISSYLINTPKTNGKDYTVAAQFVDYFKNIPSVYDQIRNLYLGSILTCYLEYQPSNANMEVILLLDTNFIISLLDLNTPESTHTCRKLLEVCKNLGYKFHLLKDTIEEIKSLLNSKSLNYDKAIIIKYINREDIYNACERRKLNSVDLDRISDNLENILTSIYGIKLIPNTDKLKNKAKFSREYSLLKPLRNSDKAALHDAMAILYVKETRKRNIKEFEKVNCWFVNNSISHDSDRESIDALLNSEQNQYQPEVIKADSLLNILWLSNPNINVELANNELVDIGLTSLVAFTLNDSLPKARIIRELDENIQKYKSEDFTDRDVLLLSTRITKRQVENIEDLNELARKDTIKFAARIKEEAKKQEIIENERAANLDNLLKEVALHINELKKHKVKLQEKDRNSTEKDHQTIIEKEKEIRKLKLQNIKAENKRREEKREEFISQKMLRWRKKTWIWLGVFITLFIGGIIWLTLICNGDVMEVDSKIESLLKNKWCALIFSVISFVFNSFIIKSLYDKHLNYSNIESYKRSIIIPNNLVPLKENIIE